MQKWPRCTVLVPIQAQQGADTWCWLLTLSVSKVQKQQCSLMLIHLHPHKKHICHAMTGLRH